MKKAHNRERAIILVLGYFQLVGFVPFIIFNLYQGAYSTAITLSALTFICWMYIYQVLVNIKLRNGQKCSAASFCNEAPLSTALEEFNFIIKKKLQECPHLMIEYKIELRLGWDLIISFYASIYNITKCIRVPACTPEGSLCESSLRLMKYIMEEFIEEVEKVQDNKWRLI